jgi:methionyl-tRNA formyltransferase
MDVIKMHIAGNLTAQPQNESDATYSLWRDEEDYLVNWNQSSETILRTINALGYPYKGAATVIEGQLVRIFEAELVTDVTIENRVAGKVLFKSGNAYTIVCGTGLIKINQFYDNEGSVIEFNNKFRLRLKNEL